MFDAKNSFADVTGAGGGEYVVVLATGEARKGKISESEPRARDAHALILSAATPGGRQKMARFRLLLSTAQNPVRRPRADSATWQPRIAADAVLLPLQSAAGSSATSVRVFRRLDQNLQLQRAISAVAKKDAAQRRETHRRSDQRNANGGPVSLLFGNSPMPTWAIFSVRRR